MFSELTGDLLAIYLNDHLAGAVAGLQLARRTAGENAGTEYGDFLERLAADVEADRRVLEDVMARLGVAEDPVKQGVAWLGEKLGRLKLNGRLKGYSPLSRLIELEGLALGVNGKLRLWRALASIAPAEPRLAEFDFVHLSARAEEQIADIDEHHVRAAEEALAPQAR
jgi:hypothetical protein